MISFTFRTRTFQFLKNYSTKIKHGKVNKLYGDTVLLPKTNFEQFPKNIVERDEYIHQKAKFGDYYKWQRKHVKGKEFVLHDGPPYANGAPHMGHAINKILKDIILRSQLVQGLKVHFVPGWDCHGLPIELIAVKDSSADMSPLEIREKSRQWAFDNMEFQKESFKKWGVIGNWDEPYYTCNPDYVVHQLKLFWKLYEQGFIFHGLKPVFWSASSKTALAESELEYNPLHKSLAVTVRLAVKNNSDPEPMYLLIWTTTPWTLPLNKAVYFSKELHYSLVKISSLSGSYILATNLIEENKQKLQKDISVIRSVSHEELGNLKYIHPWYKDDVMSTFEDSTVKEVATGLLHCVPAHGHNDFLLGLRDKLSVEAFVDENGCYTKEMGPVLSGANVLKEGSAVVTEKLKDDIILQESYVHSYPYDWRTNEPVIIRASKQWFIDTDKLKSECLECLSDVSVPMNNFRTILESRPYWCLSRQRIWGVPIPAFFNKKTGEPLVSEEAVDHFCKIVKKSGADSWWSFGNEELLPQHICDKFGVKAEDIERGNDIMDVWFDSGISWAFVLENKIADLCLEGVDQFGGWFQSSLLTSVAIRGQAPYKKLLIHGSAVDENGRKMSKSVGNVFDPNTVIDGKEALGVDTLRWWVSSHGQRSKVAVSLSLMKDSGIEVSKLRLLMRFILGALNYSRNTDFDASQLYHLDRYCLSASYDVYYAIIEEYNKYNISSAASLILHFTKSIASALYVTAVKDRLYCDDVNSGRRKCCIYTLCGILDTLCHCIAPILPHLAEEVYLHHPIYSGKSVFYSEKMWEPPSAWKNESVEAVIKLGKNIKLDILSITQKPQEFSCLIEAGEEDYNLLKELQKDGDRSEDSELTELLQVASVELRRGNYKVTLVKTENRQCPRCRRFTASKEELCSRCESVQRQREEAKSLS